jgi:Mitochondrial domain of unknown function (DUF1713)
MFPRFLRPIQPFSRRSYSLFSKPPGGRFFNSSKPPKVVPSASAKSATRVDPTKASNDPPQQASSSSYDDEFSVSPSTVPSPVPPALSSAPAALASHPPLSPSDLRLHQFFAQHRPLVLSQPPTALFDTSPTLALGPAIPQTPATAFSTLDDPPETTPEADADTARLLARTLAMNAVSSTVSWDATLRRLGLNPADGREAENAVLEGLSVELDSTRRKRRKKMKKHKYVKPLSVPAILIIMSI